MSMAGKQYHINDLWVCTKCEEKHEFSCYVAAHWDIALTHICACGQKHSIQEGWVEPIV